MQLKNKKKLKGSRKGPLFYFSPKSPVKNDRCLSVNFSIKTKFKYIIHYFKKLSLILKRRLAGYK